MIAVFRIRKSMYKSFLISALAVPLLTGALVEAAPGDLDTTFSTDGLVITSIDTSDDLANAIAVLPDGKILVAGRSKTTTLDLNIALLRYNADGTLDTTFDADGIVTTLLGGDATANAMTAAPDGSIYLAGRGSGAFILVKFTSAGALDMSFAAGAGYVVVPVGTGNSTCTGMAITPAGNFVLVGSEDIGGGNFSIALVQINTAGTVDTSFGGGDGIVSVNPGVNTSHGYAVAVQPDGRILVAGDVDGTTFDLALLRFNSDGSADTTFDTDGIVTTDVAGFHDIGFAIALQPDGRILVAGTSGVGGSGNDFSLLRYLADGSLDTSFDTDGITTTAVSTSYFSDKARALVIQPDGKIIAGGFARDATDTHDDFAAVRFNSNGSLDTTFGTGGIVTTPIGGMSYENETCYALALQTDGKVVLAESNNSGGATQEIWVARYLAVDADNNASTAEPWDVTPNAFTFTDTTGVAPSSVQTSRNIIVAGLGSNVYVPVTITGGEYAINSGSYTTATGYVTNGNEISVRHTASASITTQTDTVLTLGGLHAPNNTSQILGTRTSDTFSSTTGQDLTPDAFSFTDVTNVAHNATMTSNTITVTSITAPTTISITGGTYSINGGTYTSTTGTVANGDTVAVRHTSASTDSTAVNTTLTIGGVSDIYTSTTSDLTPANFTFSNITNVVHNATMTSNTITVSGITAATTLSITGGSYSVNGGGYTSTAGSVSNGNTVTVQHTSGNADSTAVNTALTIGGVLDIYTSTTSDLTPAAFTFTDVNIVAHSTQMTSNSITVLGITAAIQISVTGGTYSVNGGAYVSTASTVMNGNTVAVRHTSSAADTTAINTTLTIGGISDTYTSTTSDLTPAAFNFTDATHVAHGATMTSNNISVSGITAATPISVSGGSYAINDGTYTSSPGTVMSGDSVTVRHTSAVTASTATSTTLTIGDVSDTFTSTTADDVIPDAFSFTEVTAVATSSTQSSNSITVAGITAATGISVSGGAYSVNGGLYTSTSGVVVNGDTITVQQTSAATTSTTTHTTLTIGGIAGVFTSTTASAGGSGSAGGGGTINTWWLFLFLLPLWISRNKSRLQPMPLS